MGRRKKSNIYGTDLDVSHLDKHWLMELINHPKRKEIWSCAIRREVSRCEKCIRYKDCWKNGNYVG